MHSRKIGYRPFGEMAHSIIPFSLDVYRNMLVFRAFYKYPMSVKDLAKIMHLEYLYDYLFYYTILIKQYNSYPMVCQLEY